MDSSTPLLRRCLAEVMGTFWLVFGGCGSAVLAAAYPNAGIGLLGVSLAFGLTILTMAYAIGHISGCHLNPAVSVGLAVAKRFRTLDVPAYIVAQTAGAIIVAGALYLIASGKAGFDLNAGLASNGYGAHSPGGYTLMAGLCIEVLLTFMFLTIILGATDERAPQGGRSCCHRPRPDVDSPDWNSRHERVGQPGAQHRSSPDCGRLGDRAALAVLGSAFGWSSTGRHGMAGSRRRARD